MGLSNAQHEGNDVIVIKGSIGATRKETQPGMTQCRREASVFNTAGRKVSWTGGRDPKVWAAVREMLGLEKLAVQKKNPQP